MCFFAFFVLLVRINKLSSSYENETIRNRDNDIDIYKYKFVSLLHMLATQNTSMKNLTTIILL